MPDDAGIFSGVFGRGRVGAGSMAWLEAMLEVEAALARALERAGLAPEGAGAAVTEAARPGNFDVAELGALAALTGNPVPALARALAGKLPKAAAGAVHHGATSQDILDTAMMLLAARGIDVILADLAAAARAAAALAAEHRSTIMIGRTLLQQATPVTFGLVAAGWLTGIDEARQGLAQVRAQRLAVQFGGAAGTLASLGEAGPRVAGLLAGELGLTLPVLPWHTDRLRILDVSAALARADAVLGKIARDVTLLAQSEVGEVSEGEPITGPGAGTGPDAPRRGGSSAMPNKQNPVAAIAILGCTRQVPGLLATLTAAAEQEHQRAAGAWHAEWEPLAALLRLTGSAASWGAELLGGLEVHPGRMRANLAAAGGFPLAERVTSLLAPALGRTAAHDLVAGAGARAARAGRPLRDALLQDPEPARRLAEAGISAEQVEAALDPAGYLGAAGAFTDAALAAHRRAGGTGKTGQGEEGSHG
jgi:3-carboxy-cis,cis-muconate cycloisomerase